MLEIKKLGIKFKQQTIVKRIDLKLKRGELIILMGPNGSGKSTLAKTLLNHPDYIIKQGTIWLDGKNITKLKPEEIVQQGLLLAWQNPVAIPGVNLVKLLRETKQENKPSKNTSITQLRDLAKKMDFSEGLLIRGLNDGFSGGEKKKIEMLQVYTLAQKYVVFDEIDTGLDIDALKTIAKLIQELRANKIGCLVITHYQRIIELLKADQILVMVDGQIVRKGGLELVREIEKKGYRSIIPKSKVIYVCRLRKHTKNSGKCALLIATQLELLKE